MIRAALDYILGFHLYSLKLRVEFLSGFCFFEPHLLRDLSFDRFKNTMTVPLYRRCINIEQGFSTGGDFASQETFGNVWRRF